MKKGFTLIELLIVVLITATLSAIALPQYRRSIERSRMTEFVQMAPALEGALSRYFAENIGETEIPSFSLLDVSAKGTVINAGRKRLCTANFCYGAYNMDGVGIIVARALKGRYRGVYLIHMSTAGTGLKVGDENGHNFEWVNHQFDSEGNPILDKTGKMKVNSNKNQWFCWEETTINKGACSLMGMPSIQGRDEAWLAFPNGARYSFTQLKTLVADLYPIPVDQNH